MTDKISFIFFDIGGVLIKDYTCSDKWEQTKQSLGVEVEKSSEFDQIWHELANPRVCIDYDVDQLIPELKQRLDLDIPNDYSLLQNFVDRFERNEHIWPLVHQVSQTCKIGMLTNMYPGMLDRIKSTGLLDEINWDVVVDSSQVKLQKPDNKIFMHAQQAAKVAPSQILFIDNTQGHLDSAASLGWQIHYFDSCDYQASTRKLGQLLQFD